MSVDVIVEYAPWEGLGLEALAERAVAATLAHLGLVPDEWDVVVLGCDDARIAALNADFRGKPRPTNVLSWPSEERAADRAGDAPAPPSGDRELGDIAIAWQTTMAEAQAGGLPPGNHVLHLLVHGTLHLLGYDHEAGADGDLMESVEIAILEGLGVPDPYDGPGATGA